MTSEAEAAALGHANFWDERYAKADDGEKPTHEWFRDFASLEPFFSRHLFAVRDPTTRPRIMHLGSGDSVSFFHISYSWSCADFYRRYRPIYLIEGTIIKYVLIFPLWS